MMETYETTKNINGPINVVRLEGKINNIKKVLYVFFDFHVHEKKCADLISLNIDQYLIREMNKLQKQNTKINYDYFLEEKVSNAIFQPDQYTYYQPSYIHELTQTFHKYRKHIKNTDLSNKIRLHYMDMRMLTVYDAFDYIPNLVKLLHNGNYTKAFDEIDYHIQRIQKLIDILNNPIKPEKSENINLIDMENENIHENFDKYIKFFNSIIYKLKNKYTSSTNQKIINKYISIIIKNFENIVENQIKMLITIENMYKLNSKKINKLDCDELDCGYKQRIFTSFELTSLMEIIYSMKSYYDLTNVLLTDLYFLRRFIDKDYITNSVIYTGASHSVHYIYFLIKYYNFNITNAYYSKYPLDKLSDKIKHMDLSIKGTFKELQQIFFPEDFAQCVSLDGFPDLFL